MKGALGIAAVGIAGAGLYAGYNALKKREQNQQMSARDEFNSIIEFALRYSVASGVLREVKKNPRMGFCRG